jgi:hypothetical protein
MSFKVSDWLSNPQEARVWFVTDPGYLNSVLPPGWGDEEQIAFNESIGNPAFCWVDYASFVPALAHKESVLEASDQIITNQIYMETPLGRKGWTVPVKKDSAETKLGDAVRAPVEAEEDFALFDWFRDAVKKNDWSEAREHWTRKAGAFGTRADLAIFICPPSELLYWTRRADLFFLCHDDPERYQHAMDCILDAYETILSIAADCGVRIAGYGAPGGTEFTSPSFWDEWIVPSSQRLEAICRKLGLDTLFHCCGKISTIAEQGLISRIAPAVYETAAPPPVGDVTALDTIRRQICPQTVIHGNLDLSLLKNGSADDVLSAAEQVVAAMNGAPCLIGASDACLWPGTPAETLEMICRRYNP